LRQSVFNFKLLVLLEGLEESFATVLLKVKLLLGILNFSFLLLLDVGFE